MGPKVVGLLKRLGVGAGFLLLVAIAVSVLAIRSSSGQHLTSSAASPAAIASPSPGPIAFRYKDATFTATGPADCQNLPSAYYVSLCTDVVNRDWRAVQAPANPDPRSPAEIARLLIGLVTDDPSVCSDAAVVTFIEAGDHVGKDSAGSICTTWIANTYPTHSIELSDPTTKFNDALLYMEW